MPHINISLIEGKSDEQKRQLSDEFVRVAKEILGFGDDSFSVSIEDYTKEEWKEEVYPNQIMKHPEKLYKQPGYKM